MNRAWIPAGALAGVSVAGLIALAPLTDSLGTNVAFPVSVRVPQAATTTKVSVPVSVNLKAVGSVKTVELRRGGQASTIVTSNADAGQVGYRRSVDKTVQAPVVTTTTPPVAKPPVKKPPRPASIGGTSGANGDAGLAGGNQDATGVGEQAVTPGG